MERTWKEQAYQLNRILISMYLGAYRTRNSRYTYSQFFIFLFATQEIRTVLAVSYVFFSVHRTRADKIEILLITFNISMFKKNGFVLFFAMFLIPSFIMDYFKEVTVPTAVL